MTHKITASKGQNLYQAITSTKGDAITLISIVGLVKRLPPEVY